MMLLLPRYGYILFLFFFRCTDDPWLQCSGGRCGCRPAFHTPTNWTQFVLARWDYRKVDAEQQNCIASK